jgi:hypothetical protein
VVQRSFVQTVVVILVAGSLLAAAAGLQHLREQQYPVPVVSGDSLYITSGRALRYMTAGYHALAADLYWIRTIQYYGNTKLKLNGGSTDPAAIGRHGSGGDEATQYNLLHPLLDLTTELDPRFNIAYRFGAIFLAETPPAGPGRPDLAIALLEKGLRARPDKWEYMQDIGFVHYWWTHDFKAAADWFQRASEIPGAPWFLRSLAATTLAEGGDRRSSRQMWEAIHQTAEIDWLRNEAERRLLQLTALDQIDQLQLTVDAVTRRDGMTPDWAAVIRAARFPGIPVDPTGTPYDIDASGRVKLSQRSRLFPLPVEPQRLVTPRVS